MEPLVVGRLYVMRWQGRVWRRARYTGRQAVRRGILTISGPTFESPAGILTIRSWEGIEIEPEPQIPTVIETDYQVVGA